jgi:diguanylate cyclase (GGDEF)-like protein/PAS domain S-box-containing protein
MLALTIGGVCYWLIAQTLEKQLKVRLATNTLVIANTTRSFLDSTSRVFVQLSEDKAVLKYAKSYNELALLRGFEQYIPSFEWISYANVQGVEEVKRNRDDHEPKLETVSSTILFSRSMALPNRVHLSDSKDGISAEGKPEVHFGIFIVDYFGQRLGYISAQLGLTGFNEYLTEFVRADDVAVYVADSGGQIIYDSQETGVGRYITRINDTESTVDVFENVSMLRTSFLDYGDCLVAKAFVPGYDWQVFSVMTYADYVLPLRTLRTTIAGVIGLVSIVLAGLKWLLVRKLLQPVGMLTQATHQVAYSGDLSGKVEWASTDELGFLANSFNHMLERLRSSQEALFEERSYTENIISSIADAVIVTDTKNVIVKINQAVEDLTGISADEIIGRKAMSLVASDQQAAIISMGKMVFLEGRIRSMESSLTTKGGREVAVSVSGAMIEDLQGKHIGNVFVAKDITSLKQAQAHLNHLANHDSLTGLPNRLLLEDRLNQALARIAWHNRTMALLLLDLDQFKLVNDTLGHSAGDMLLKVVAKRLCHCVRDGDTVARLGGDEFVVVLDDMAKVDDIKKIADKILKLLREPIDLQGHKYTATTSIGISYAPQQGSSPDALMKNADTAMYQAKRAGRNNYQIYDPQMHLETRSLFHMEVELRKALENNEFEVFYQPIVEAGSRRTVAVEALVRWPQADGTVRSPADFLQIAEDIGLILPLGRKIFEDACRDVKGLHDKGFTHLVLSVNISDRQFRDSNLSNTIKKVLHATQFPVSKLDLELTEGILIDDDGQATKTLNTLRQLGVTLSVDDFGTGYSSLGKLKRFPLDTLKIDRSFVAGLPDSKSDRALTTAIIGLAHKLGLQVVAEGVENEEQAAYLENEGAERFQGYFFSPAVSVEQLEKFLSS